MSDAQQTPSLPLVPWGSDRSPQEVTTTRLPTPSQNKFCEPCKAFVRGERTECLDNRHSFSEHEYIHHVDAKSFQRALELPCVICIRLHKAFRNENAQGHRAAYVPGPTRYWFDFGYLHFGDSDSRLYPLFIPYESISVRHYWPLTRSTGDVKALSFFKDQYHQCREQHSMCQRLAPYNDFVPTRAIYVGSVGEQLVHLCDSVEMIAGASYAVLSHCWGKDPQRIMLTKRTEETLKQGIALSCLPKTFQDAIAVTRIFQIRCIFQDDLHDWAAEASRMRDIYSKADFCIAATGAESGDVGLFFDRDVEQLTSVMVEATWSSIDDSTHLPTPGLHLFGFHYMSATRAIDWAPLNRRAWVAQERFLSPRTMHFTQSLLFWECHTSLKSENDITPESKHNSELNELRVSLNDLQGQEPGVEPIQDIALHDSIVKPNVGPIREVYGNWSYFLTFYTSGKITKESDILVALVGVADEVGRTVSDKLVAGLWKANFIKELCWISHSNSRPSVWRAPTWSWASVSGGISRSPLVYFGNSYDMAAVVKLSVLTKPSGEVEQGSVLVKCRPVSGTIHHDGKKYCYTWGTLDKSISTSHSAESSIPREYRSSQVWLDVPDVPYYNADQVVDVRLLLLLKEDHNPVDPMDPKGSSELVGIGVVESGDHAGAFERIGYFNVVAEDAESVLAAYDQAQEQEILLV